MKNIGVLDPYNLLSLVDEIDRSCIQIYSKEFPKIISDDMLQNTKLQLRDTISSIITEFYSDWSEVVANPEFNQWLGPHGTIPSIYEMANSLPVTLGAVLPSGDDEQDKINIKHWHGKRLVWAFNCWIQMISPLTTLLAVETPIIRQIPGTTMGTDEDSVVPNTAIIDTILKRWEVTRRITLEYIKVKAEFLVAIGVDCPIINLNVLLTSKQIFTEAKMAFFDGEYAATSLLLQSMRSALIEVTGLRINSAEFTIDQIPTVVLVIVCQDCGIDCGFDWTLIANLVVDLEKFQNICCPSPYFVLYPFVRIIEQCITTLANTKQSHIYNDKILTELRKRARIIIDETQNQD